jgi:hypothetical protein
MFVNSKHTTTNLVFQRFNQLCLCQGIPHAISLQRMALMKFFDRINCL